MVAGSSGPLTDLLQILRQPENHNLGFLQQVWRGRDSQVLAEGAKYFPQDVKLRQLLALSLARSGAVESANAILLSLYNEGHRDEETLGLLARTYKDVGYQSQDPAKTSRCFERAFDFYSAAYQSSRGYWSGINAATIALILGRRAAAEVLAREVISDCERRLSESVPEVPDRYWILSTIGEASLVLRHWPEAEAWYRKALQAGSGDWGSVQSTGRNARLLLRHLGEAIPEIEQLFRLPVVVAFSGHMIDRPDRKMPRFPVEIEMSLKEAIRQKLKQVNAGFGYASAACGADILFHEVLVEMEAESHVLLPFDKELFVRESVDIGSDSSWVGRFNKVLAEAAEVQEASATQSGRPDPTLYEFANLMLHGLAAVRAQQLETSLVPMAIWDGRAGDGIGGTAGAVEHWRKAGLDVEIIDPTSFLAGPRQSVEPAIAPVDVPYRDAYCSGFIPEVRALLFADVEGFSKLSDEQLPNFVEHFLGLVAKVIAKSDFKPLLRNTWGDGLYLVFALVAEAGQFALDLMERVRSASWPEMGLPRLNLRIGLHAGPVYRCEDPITERPNYIGVNVSRAARIEPITPAGYVYASQPFAALAAAEGVQSFRCNYVGQTPMAKQYGTFPTYVVLRDVSAGLNSML
jgi:class 3 adenylate cyclase